MRQWLCAAAIGAAVVPAAAADLSIGPQASIRFVSIGEAREILARRDDYARRMSAFDRAIRVRSGARVSQAAFLRFAAANARAWTDQEKVRVESAYAAIAARLVSLRLPWPPRMTLVKTTGNEEGGAAYTREYAIILPAGELTEEASARLAHVLAHELFHILSRANPRLRAELYAAIGFRPCPELALSPKLQAVIIMNPDAPADYECIRVQYAGARRWATPLMVSSTPTPSGRTFFDHLQVRLLLLGGGDEPPPAGLDARSPKLVRFDEVSGFYEQVGRNTEYVAHPEEILADNFALLVRGVDAVSSPEILQRMEAVLRAAGRCVSVSRPTPRTPDAIARAR